MKHLLLFILLFATITATAQNVGIGTKTPQRSLHVVDSAGHTNVLLESPSFTYDKDVSLELKQSIGSTDWLRLKKYSFLSPETMGGVSMASSGTLFTGLDAADLKIGALRSNGQVDIFAGGQRRMVIGYTGNVGIGTGATPAAPLHILSPSYEAVRIQGPNAAQTFYNNSNYVGYLQAYQNIMSLAADGSNRLGLFTQQTERLTVLPNGNIGIGNAAPQQVLDVTGNIKFTGTLMPANQPGTDGTVLMSRGAGITPEWHSPGNILLSNYYDRNISTQFFETNGTYQVFFNNNPGFLFAEPTIMFYNLMFKVNDIDEPFGADTDFDLEVRFKDQLNAVTHSQKKNFIIKNGRMGMACSMSGMFPVGGFPLQTMNVQVYITKYGGGQMSLVNGGLQVVY